VRAHRFGATTDVRAPAGDRYEVVSTVCLSRSLQSLRRRPRGPTRGESPSGGANRVPDLGDRVGPGFEGPPRESVWPNECHHRRWELGVLSPGGQSCRLRHCQGWSPERVHRFPGRTTGRSSVARPRRPVPGRRRSRLGEDVADREYRDRLDREVGAVLLESRDPQGVAGRAPRDVPRSRNRVAAWPTAGRREDVSARWFAGKSRDRSSPARQLAPGRTTTSLPMRATTASNKASLLGMW